MGKRRPAKRPPSAPSKPAIAPLDDGPIFPLWPPDLPVLRLDDGITFRLWPDEIIDISALLDDFPPIRFDDPPPIPFDDGPPIRLDDGLDLIDLSALLNDGPTSNPPKARQVRRRRPLVPLSYPT